MSDCSAILLAAGASRRLGFDKILTPLAGKPGITYSAEVLAAHPDISEIIVVTRADLEEKLQSILQPIIADKPFRIIPGGKERQDSVLAGLEGITSVGEFALIHDGARPLLSAGLIDRVLERARETGAAICGRPCSDTLKVTSDQETIESTPDRSRYWQVETPQIFRLAWILEAYRKVIASGLAVTDDASALEHTGRPVSLVDSPALNLKITRQVDWELLEFWLCRGEGEALRQRLHEVNNSLTPLTGYLPLLKKNSFQPEKNSKYLEAIETGSKHAVSSLHAAQELARGLFPGKTDDD